MNRCKLLYKECIAQFNLVLTRKILLVRERNIRLITPDVNLCLDSSIVIYAGLVHCMVGTVKLASGTSG